jgi:hypothetical protein
MNPSDGPGIAAGITAVIHSRGSPMVDGSAMIAAPVGTAAGVAAAMSSTVTGHG